ncbi:hypothetical protein H4R35_005933 [Dimargaris xerosporica]|nr:hypothetical protein H4R35_005933 [Dimargaris xerosporica]
MAVRLSICEQYAPTSRASCRGPKSCPDKKIQKGQLRFASIDESGSFTTKYWRHWGCVTSAILAKIPAAGSIVGLEDLTPEDQRKVEEAVHSQRQPSASNIAESAPDQAASPSATDRASVTHPDTKTSAKKPRKRKSTTTQDGKASTVDKERADSEEVPATKKSRTSAPAKQKRKSTSRRAPTNKGS